jgi:hypothetical protein
MQSIVLPAVPFFPNLLNGFIVEQIMQRLRLHQAHPTTPHQPNYATQNEQDGTKHEAAPARQTPDQQKRTPPLLDEPHNPLSTDKTTYQADQPKSS